MSQPFAERVLARHRTAPACCARSGRQRAAERVGIAAARIVGGSSRRGDGAQAVSCASMNKPVVSLVTPALAAANNGNWQTARRWARMLAGDYRVRSRAPCWSGEPADAAARAACAPLGAEHRRVGRAVAAPPAGRGADRHRPVPRPARRRRGRAALARAGAAAGRAARRRARRPAGGAPRQVPSSASSRRRARRPLAEDRPPAARRDGRPPARGEGPAHLLRCGAPARRIATTSLLDHVGDALDAALGARGATR